VNTPLVAPTNPPTTPIAPRNTSVKHKRSNVFPLVIKALDMNIKSLIDAMECTKKHNGKIMKRTTKKQLKYLKSRKRKIHHTSKNMVNVLTSLSLAMCHAFIQDKTNLFPLVHLLSDSLEDENRQDNIQMLNDDEEEAI